MRAEEGANRRWASFRKSVEKRPVFARAFKAIALVSELSKAFISRFAVALKSVLS